MKDRAGAVLAHRTGLCQPAQRGAGGLQFGDPAIERGETVGSQHAGPGAVVRRVQAQEFADLLQREARRLRRADEAQGP